jgi:hypothetical protein
MLQACGYANFHPRSKLEIGISEAMPRSPPMGSAALKR